MNAVQIVGTLVTIAAGMASIVTGIYARRVLSDAESLPMQREAVANAFVMTTLGFLLALGMLVVVRS